MIRVYNRLVNWFNDDSDNVIDRNGNPNKPWYKWAVIMLVFVGIPAVVITGLGILAMRLAVCN